MNLQEFYENHCIPIMGMSQDAAESIEEEQYTGVINTILVDCSDINNTIRAKKGEEALENKWYMAEDELPYDYGLLANCMCYGVASRLYVDEASSEANIVSFLEANYEAGKAKFINADYEDVTNIWQGLEAKING